jgi:hypothetical protein
MCWYCEHGWPEPVQRIYDEASALLGDRAEHVLDYGPGHVVWADSNLDDNCVNWCIDHHEEYRRDLTDFEMQVSRSALTNLLAIPTELRDTIPQEAR